jgi:hypothetical protein
LNFEEQQRLLQYNIITLDIGGSPLADFAGLSCVHVIPYTPAHTVCREQTRYVFYDRSLPLHIAWAFLLGTWAGRPYIGLVRGLAVLTWAERGTGRKVPAAVRLPG